MSRDIPQQRTEAESDSHELPTKEKAPDPMESAYQEISALLEDAPEALTQEIEKTRVIIAQMIERAQSVNLDAEDISEFEDAMQNIIAEMKHLAKTAENQLASIQAEQDFVAQGLLDAEDVSDIDPEELLMFQKSVDTVIRGVLIELQKIQGKRRDDEMSSTVRERLGSSLQSTELFSSDLKSPPPLALVPSESLQKQRTAFAEASKKGLLSPELLAKAQEKLAAAEQKEQAAWDTEHGGNPADEAFLDRIRTSMDEGTLDKLFAKKGFDADKALTLIADRIRAKAFSGELDNKVLMQLPKELLAHIVDDMSDAEFMARMKGMQKLAEQGGEFSYLYVSEPYKKRSVELQKKIEQARNVVVYHSKYDGTQQREMLYEKLQRNPEGPDAQATREKLLSILKSLEEALVQLEESGFSALYEIGRKFPDAAQQIGLRDFKAQVESAAPTEGAGIAFYKTMEEHVSRYDLEEKGPRELSAITVAERKLGEQWKAREEETKQEREMADAIEFVLSRVSQEARQQVERALDTTNVPLQLRDIEWDTTDIVGDVKRLVLEKTAYGKQMDKPFFGSSVSLSQEQRDAISALDGTVPESGKMKYDQYKKRYDAVHSANTGHIQIKRSVLVDHIDVLFDGIPSSDNLQKLLPTAGSVTERVLQELARRQNIPEWQVAKMRPQVAESIDIRPLQEQVTQQIREHLATLNTQIDDAIAQVQKTIEDSQESVTTYAKLFEHGIQPNLVYVLNSLDAAKKKVSRAEPTNT